MTPADSYAAHVSPLVQARAVAASSLSSQPSHLHHSSLSVQPSDLHHAITLSRGHRHPIQAGHSITVSNRCRSGSLAALPRQPAPPGGGLAAWQGARQCRRRRAFCGRHLLVSRHLALRQHAEGRKKERRGARGEERKNGGIQEAENAAGRQRGYQASNGSRFPSSAACTSPAPNSDRLESPSATQPIPQPSPDPSTAPRLLRHSLCRIPAQQRAAAQTPHFCH